MNGKTMTDVIADIRKRAENAYDAWLNDPTETVHHEAVSVMLLHIADEVEAAWKRDTEHLEAFSVETHHKQFAEMRGEIERLREALKQVLDVRPEKSWTVEKNGTPVFCDKYGAETLVTAVRKAQEIMRGANA